jgi:RNA polymerase sigma factor (sigma-70 family)
MEPRTTSARAKAEATPSPVLPLHNPMVEKPTLRAVFDAEESPLLRFAYSLVGQRETAEDLVQDAFVRLHTHWDEVANPRAWLFRSIRNLALNHLRDHRRESPLDPSVDPPDSSPNPDQTLGKLEAIGTLQLLIAELPPEERQLIRLKYHQDLRYEQISTQTGLSIGNVGYKLHHLLKSLADSLRRMGIDSPEC